MAPDALLDAPKSLRIRRRLSVVVTHVNVNERRASLVGLVRGLYLLGNADRDGGVLRLLGQRTRDRDADDERLAGRA
jgi:hypothetical protein